MNPGMMKPIGKPRPIGSKMPVPGAQEEQQEAAGRQGQDAHYTGSDQRCATCEYFDGNQTCRLKVNGGVVEPMGHCDYFEAAEDGGNEGDAEQFGGDEGEE